MGALWKPLRIDKKYTPYFVSSDGQIGYASKGTIAIKKTFITAKYEYVSLFLNGRNKNFRVNRLVAKTFLGRIEGKEVNHINGNKLDNRAANLEICTKKQNQQHSVTIINSRPRGASFRSDRNKWRATITVSERGKKKQKFIGFFDSKSEAQEAFYKEFIKLHGVAPWQK